MVMSVKSPENGKFTRLYELPDLSATERLAAHLAPCLKPGDVVALRGDLGAGKTAFARALIRALMGDEAEEVPSPTFNLLLTYEAEAGTVYHFDLYRLDAAQEAYELGIEEAFDEGITLIEWPDRLGALLPEDRLDLTLEILSDSARRGRLEGGASWAERLEELPNDD